MNWKPGDLAKIEGCVSNPESNGSIVLVTSRPEKYIRGYRVEIDGIPGAVWADVKVLKPFYDGDQPGSWKDCVWKPKELDRVS